MRFFLLLLLLLTANSQSLLAGPPFQTDDPEPVPYKHYEFYTFASAGSTHLETDTLGPATEINWGAVPNVQLHLIVPAAAAFPSDGPATFGLGDIETGIKYRFIQETKHRPMIGTFTMLEMPTVAWASASYGRESRFGFRKALTHGPLMEVAEW